MNVFRRIFLFLLVNILVVTTITTLGWFFGFGHWMGPRGLNLTQLALFSVIWGFAGSLISLCLSAWIAKVSMGVRIVTERDGPEASFLCKIVKELSEEAGLSRVPSVGIYASPELNAFATGPSEKRALVAVSSGLLRSMQEEPLRAVLGHEISHIKNGDMVTMTLLQGTINAFVIFFSRVVAYAFSGGKGNQGQQGGSFIGMWGMTMLLEILFMALGGLVIAAFSRWREFRADRGGAQLVSPMAMIGALQTLEKASGRILPNRDPPAIAALKISSSKKSWLSLYSSHPPLEERIERLRQISS